MAQLVPAGSSMTQEQALLDIIARASSKADISFPGGGLQRALRRVHFVKVTRDEMIWANFA